MRTKIFILSIIGLLFSAPLFADSGINDSGCGVTNYSGGSGMLYDMAVTIGGMMLFTLELCNAIAALLAIYSATIVYLKMIHGEEGGVEVNNDADRCMYLYDSSHHHYAVILWLAVHRNLKQRVFIIFFNN